MEKNYSIIEELSIENIELKVNKIHDMCKQEIEDMTNRFTEQHGFSFNKCRRVDRKFVKFEDLINSQPMESDQIRLFLDFQSKINKVRQHSLRKQINIWKQAYKQLNMLKIMSNKNKKKQKSIMKTIKQLKIENQNMIQKDMLNKNQKINNYDINYTNKAQRQEISRNMIQQYSDKTNKFTQPFTIRQIEDQKYESLSEDTNQIIRVEQIDRAIFESFVKEAHLILTEGRSDKLSRKLLNHQKTQIYIAQDQHQYTFKIQSMKNILKQVTFYIDQKQKQVQSYKRKHYLNNYFSDKIKQLISHQENINLVFLKKQRLFNNISSLIYKKKYKPKKDYQDKQKKQKL